ncbi:MAG: DUF3899 domain-containing protein [Bacilli bacterium]|nr:DUF3899 domain-containing protein [Bacilli bacterium]
MGQVIGNYMRNHWVKFIVAFLIAFANLAIFNSAAGSWTALISYCDGAFIGGASVVFIGGLSWVNSLGGFDLASYYFGRKKTESGFEDYYQYVDRKKETRREDRFGFLPYLIVGVLYIIVAAVLLAFIPRG